jgi:hypothetical protein
LRIPSTQRGYWPEHFRALGIIAVVIVVARFVDQYASKVHANASLRPYQFRYETDYSGAVLEWLPWVTAAIIGYILLERLYRVIYSVREVSTFIKNSEGRWGEVRGVVYRFPANKTQQKKYFDRIIDVTVYQTMLDRVFGVGTLEVEIVTYTNLESEEVSWTMPAVKDPHEWEKQIVAYLPKGDAVRIARGSAS